MERVIVTRNESPLLLISPHSHKSNDDFTGLITEIITENLGCNCVINQGWKRADQYDYDKGRANCNNVTHCHCEVVREEFLDPIMSIVSSIISEFNEAQIILIHGFGKQIRKSVKGNIDGVVGYGTVNQPSCEIWRKNAFLYCSQRNKLNFYQGKAGGKYSGANQNNLNQLYRKWYNDHNVNSLQLELVKELRENQDMSEYTAETLTKCIENYMEMIETIDDSGDRPVWAEKDWEVIGSKALEF